MPKVVNILRFQTYHYHAMTGLFYLKRNKTTEMQLNMPPKFTPAAREINAVASTASAALRYKSVSCIAMMLVALSISSVSPAAAQKATQSQPIVSWPLSTLSVEEKESRLQFFLGVSQYKLKPAFGDIKERDCQDLLDSLKQPQEHQVLSPTVISKGRSDKMAASVINQCPNVQIDRAWFWHGKEAYQPGKDAKFDALNPSEKEAGTDFFYRYDDEIEFYDLSSFFPNSKVVGTFSDHGTVVCNNAGDKLCKSLVGYFQYTGPIGTAVDLPSCQTMLTQQPKSGSPILLGTAHRYGYREKPSFSAFIEIAKKVYRVGLRSTFAWADFSKIVGEPEAIEIDIEPVSKSARSMCQFISNPKIKAKI